jgi:hypothetical protein
MANSPHIGQAKLREAAVGAAFGQFWVALRCRTEVRYTGPEAALLLDRVRQSAGVSPVISLNTVEKCA